MVTRPQLSEAQMMELLSASAMDRREEQERIVSRIEILLGPIIFDRLADKAPLLSGFGYRICDTPTDLLLLMAMNLLISVNSAKASLQVREIKESADQYRLVTEEVTFANTESLLTIALEELKAVRGLVNGELSARRDEEVDDGKD